MQRCNKLVKLEQNCKAKVPNESFSSKWSLLDQQILSKIAEILEYDSPSDKFRFQLVCKSWFNSCSSSNDPFYEHVLYSILPLEIYNIPSIFIQDKGPIFIVGICVYLVQPLEQPLTQPWLVSFEEFNLGKLRVHAPLTKKPIRDLPLNFLKGVDFSGFWVSLVCDGMKICLDGGSDDVVRVQEKNSWFHLDAKTKVVLVSNEESLDCSDFVAVVLMISEGGTLMSFDVTTGKWMILELGIVCLFDDIVCWNGLVYAMDRKGRVYLIAVDDDTAELGDAIAEAMCGAIATDNRKRLVVLDDELYMINRICKKFEVFKLNEGLKKWEEVETLGDKIVLVTIDEVFGVNASEFPGCKGNCILFTKQCFPSYMGRCSFENKIFRKAEMYLEVGVQYLGEDRPFPISFYPELCDVLRPFPSWICSNSSVASSSSGCKEVEEHHRHSSSLIPQKSSREAPVTPIASYAQTCREDTTRSESRVLLLDTYDSPRTVHSTSQIHGSSSFLEAPHTTCGEVPEKHFPEIIDLDSLPDDDVASPDKNVEDVQKFEGVNVSSYFIPILNEIRNKHGYIIELNVDEVQSGTNLRRLCLEMLAKTVKILQSESARSLSDSDAKYLKASRPDFEFMRLNVEVVNWLVPLIDSALDHHQKKERIYKVKELLCLKSKLLYTMRQVDDALKEEEELIASESLSVPPLSEIKGLI